MGEDDEEDYGALIYRESQLRKAEEAAAVADAKAAKDDAKKKKKSSVDVSSTRRRATSTRATSSAARTKPVAVAAQRKGVPKRKRESLTGDEEHAPRKVARKKKYKSSCQRRSMCEAWSKSQTMQQRRVYK